MKYLTMIIILSFCTIVCCAQIKYEIYSNKSLLDESRKIALLQIGVTENSNRNDNSKIDEYLRTIGLASGNPYCAAGVYYCFSKAAEIIKLPVDSIPIIKTGSANMIFDKARLKGCKVIYKAHNNDLIVWKSDNSYSGHIERVLVTGKKGNITTIAFNSSEYINGKRYEGVFIKKRNIFSALAKLKVRGLIGFRS